MHGVLFNVYLCNSLEIATQKDEILDCMEAAITAGKYWPQIQKSDKHNINCPGHSHTASDYSLKGQHSASVTLSHMRNENPYYPYNPNHAELDTCD